MRVNTQSIVQADPEKMFENLQSIKGFVTAWDPNRQREVWGVQHATTGNDHLLSTSGNLLFQGGADGHFAAYAPDSGRLLWESLAYVGIMAAPVTYWIDGEQYITVVEGWVGAYGLASSAPGQRVMC